MRILLCAPYTGVVGGISRWARHIIDYYNNSTDHAEIELEIFSFSREKGGYVGMFFLKRILYGLKDYLPLMREYSRTISSKHFDIVHVTSWGSVFLMKDLFCLYKAHAIGVKSIVHFRFGRIPELYVKRNWEQKLLHKVLHLADKAVVIDQKSYDTLIKEGYVNIELLPNPLTPVIAGIIHANSCIKRNERKIVFAGHIIPTKGVFELINACKSISNITVRLVGFVSDEMRRRLTELAGKEDGWLEIGGEQDYENTIKEMLSAGVFVLPTYTEGFPNVILESMACGCPIIASAVGAIPEMLNMEGEKPTGICVEPKNIDQLRDAIMKMLDDREFADECGREAQKRVNEMYSMPVVWEKMTSVWRSAYEKNK